MPYLDAALIDPGGLAGLRGYEMSHRSYPSDYSDEERAALIARGRMLVARRKDIERELGWRVQDVITFQGLDAVQHFAEAIGMTPSVLLKYAEAAAQSSLRDHPFGPPEEG
jgi:pyrroloquinoline quinone (PQQ) biosynthesis protein C